MPSLFTLFSLLGVFFVSLQTAVAGIPGKIYGVNLGSWLVLEAWMLPQEWLDMGGERCDDCSTCVATEFAFAQAHPKTVDSVFNKHWTTWFTQDDVNKLKAAGINTVRVPLGYWLVEGLVDRKTEFFPRGGILQLRRGLKQLKDAGMQVILDHHALPGVQTAGQMFTGRCTNDVEFYTDYNYHRALVWTAVMTAISHLHSDFSSVFAIQAVNEEIMDADQTPGYGDFTKNFVRTVRAVELALGISVPGESPFVSIAAGANFTSTISAAVSASVTLNNKIFTPEVRAALRDAIPLLVEVSNQLGLGFDLSSSLRHREPLVTTFMDINWQFNNPANPADAAIGPQGYDNHLYYSFGGVADANEQAYMESICNLNRVQADAALGNSPLWFGEWALPTQFAASDEFLFKWADAQKLAYSEGRGWIFWNFKIEISDLAGDTARQWSYLEGLKRGYLTQDPSQVHNPHVCDPYKNVSTAAVKRHLRRK
ncbi:glycoside hydrolase family 5 protein [Cristinia sonorae]|uniref:Glycoside hydrolase family 5 protein n=1 Tax=Cristinia sonorae TaxID=1940300 RepID=A0A8K0UTQ9_9AGAR|nr:glycoside hydrolase family 5 protein [Cristinia sonorae]